MQRLTVLIVVCAVTSVADGSELRLLPSNGRLDGPKARQRLLVEDSEKGTWVADRTAESEFSSTNTRVATVAPDGTVTPVGNGSATIVAKVGGRSATATFSVEKI